MESVGAERVAEFKTSSQLGKELLEAVCKALMKEPDVGGKPYFGAAYNMAVEEERMIRRGAPKGTKFGKSVEWVASAHVLRMVFLYLTGRQRFVLNDVIVARPSAIYAQSVVGNFEATCRERLKGFDLTELVDLDYEAIYDVTLNGKPVG